MPRPVSSMISLKAVKISFHEIMEDTFVLLKLDFSANCPEEFWISSTFLFESRLIAYTWSLVSYEL